MTPLIDSPDVGLFGCNHKWKTVSTDFTPGANFKRVNSTSVEDILRLQCGTTHIYQKCDICGELKQLDFVGKFVSREEE